MTSTQKMIFLLVALFVSLMANLFLYFENNTRVNQVAELKDTIIELESLNQQRQQAQRQTGDQVELMQSNQQELGAMIKDLQSTLVALKADYQKSQEIAQLSAEQLIIAKEQANQFEEAFNKAQQQIRQSDVTIANLKRALNNHARQTDVPNPEDALALSELVKAVQIADPNQDIGIVQKSDQSISINIPLENLFVAGTVQLRSDANAILASIATGLKRFEHRQLQVVGHSDERPITSALANNYPTNWELSSVRASKVLVNLIDQGVDKSRFTVSGKAATAPVRDESDETAWKINRRIEIIIE